MPKPRRPAEIRFEVRGLPVPQGNLRASVSRGPQAKAHLYSSNGKALGSWRNAVASAAQPHAPKVVWSGSVEINLRFLLPRPKSERTHVGRGKERHRIRTHPNRKPDLDKLIRAVLDALTHVVFEDDARVVRISATKDWGNPGVKVTLREIPKEE